jgi:glycosyltransferase involved in cell wall biosynthesis
MDTNPAPAELRPRSVLIVHSGFDENLKYQEVITARVLARCGYRVTVYTAHHTPKRGGEAAGSREFEVIEHPRSIRIRDTFFPLGSMRPVFEKVRPDLVFLFAPNHGFPYFALRYVSPQCKLACGFSNHRNDASRGVFWGNPLMKKCFKDRWMRKIIARADGVFYNSPMTREIIEELNQGPLAVPCMTGLNYDSQDFFPIKTSAPPKKQLIAVTRISLRKSFEGRIAPVVAFLEENPEWTFVIAGLGNDEAGNRLRAHVASLSVASRITLLGMLDSDRINTLYSESAIAIWFTQSIGIQQSLGAGIPVLCQKVPTVDSELVVDGVNGYWFDGPGEFAERLNLAAGKEWDRVQVAAHNSRWDAGKVIPGFVARLGL